jgi:hypothetical protein
MINHRLLVQSKWCKTDKKKKKMNPAGHGTPVRFVVGRASHYSTKASRKCVDALVLLISL